MEVAVWIPTLITMGITLWDAQQFVRYDFTYLAYYFWFIHMIPHMTGSFFNCTRFSLRTAAHRTADALPLWQSFCRRWTSRAASS